MKEITCGGTLKKSWLLYQLHEFLSCMNSYQEFILSFNIFLMFCNLTKRERSVLL